MAGLHTHRNAGGAPTNDSGIPVPTSAVSCTPAPASAPGPPERYTDKDLYRAIKLALESLLKGQEHGQLQASSEAEDPITEEEFKDFFLQKNLGNDWAFANSILSQFRRVSQHQQESVLEWAAHLKHLQLILLAYDPVGAPAKPTMLRYF